MKERFSTTLQVYNQKIGTEKLTCPLSQQCGGGGQA
jgi:hypothetical protein